MGVAATVKSAGQYVLGKFGVYVSHQPIVGGKEPVLGSFAPYETLNEIGGRSTYCIHDSYQHRSEPQYFDATGSTDDWQSEVYRFAREIAGQYGLKSVLDIGCGSGYKLLKYFRGSTTIGTDVAETCAVLRKRHPDRQWLVSDFASTCVPQAELVIASDVIEHVPDPDMLLQYIVRIAPRFVVLSTPDRNLLRFGTHNGPPLNPTHLREWSMPELHAYLSGFFEIEEHFISCSAQATQCVLARPYSRGASEAN